MPAGSDGDRPWTRPVRRVCPVEARRAMLTTNQEWQELRPPGCAWPDATGGLRLDLRENEFKHVTREMTRKRVGREFLLRARAPTDAGRALHRADEVGPP